METQPVKLTYTKLPVKRDLRSNVQDGTLLYHVAVSIQKSERISEKRFTILGMHLFQLSNVITIDFQAKINDIIFTWEIILI